MNNKTLIKYAVKYFILLVILFYGWGFGAYLVNEKDDFSNLVGCAVFTGLTVGGAIVLRSEINKVQKKIKENNEKQTS